LDIIHNGAYTKTISERAGSIRVVDQHNLDSINRVLGRPLELRELSKAELPPELLAKFPDATGALSATIQFNMKTQAGREAFYRIEAGDINEYSIGFDPLDIDYSEVTRNDGKKTRVRNIRTIRLWEFGPVLWGMNQATMTASTKGLKEMTPDGPTRRIGDYLHARMYQTIAYCVADLYATGVLDDTEFAALVTLYTERLSSFRGAMNEDVALRPFGSSYYYELGNTPDDEQKDLSHQDTPAEPPSTPAPVSESTPAESDETATGAVKALMERATLLGQIIDKSLEVIP
jgi:phage head maturation protease